jgi:hypothetical protein
MKTKVMVLSGLLAAGACLIGCSREKEPPPGAENAAVIIEGGVGVGKVRAGMTVEQVRAELGKPQRTTANALEYTSLGFAVMPGPDGVVQVVMCGDVIGLNGPLVKRFNGRTKQGLGLGSTREELIKAYGEPTNDQRFLGNRESMRYDPLGITFSLEGGKVHHMIVRLGHVETNAPPRSIEISP